MPSPSQASILTFWGATDTVTGSRFVVEHGGTRILVDCGLFQGLKELRLRNWNPFPVDPASIDAVLLTHAHIDHCGYLPALCRDGFSGPIHCTPGTADLVKIVLPDSGHLHEEDAAYANRKGFSKHHPALPLYTEADARTSLHQLEALPHGELLTLPGGIEATFRRAGQILGSSVIRLRLDGPGGGHTLVFSGDLGRDKHPLLLPPEPLADVDTVLIESTYGDRTHERDAVGEQLGEVIRRTVGNGGKVLIPAFAVDRTEVILHHLHLLVEAGDIPSVPVYVDSPMALRALEVYRRAIADRSPELRPEVVDGHDPFDVGTLHEVRDPQESMALDRDRHPAIIISASGMATGGRIVHHLNTYVSDHRNTVVLVGFQAAGTRGRALAEGARQLKMLGRYVPVRADVVTIDGLSVHADQHELIRWLSTAATAPDEVFVVHGEPDSSRALAQRVDERLGWLAVVPTQGERVRLALEPDGG